MQEKKSIKNIIEKNGKNPFKSKKIKKKMWKNLLNPFSYYYYIESLRQEEKNMKLNYYG